MSYIQGFVMAVPTANRDAFVEHSRKAADLIREFGATRVVDTWGDDVPDGKLNDFKGAVKAKADETVCFGWMEFADKAASNAAFQKMMSDPRMQAIGEMPFDGKRMIFGGFEPLMDDRAGNASASRTTRYIDGFVLPVSPTNRDAYRAMALKAFEMFRDHGLIRNLEAWGDDVPRGQITDFYRAAHAEGEEDVVFAFLEWPDKATRDAGMKAVMEDPRIKEMPSPMPFDGKRMIFGGFEVLPT